VFGRLPSGATPGNLPATLGENSDATDRHRRRRRHQLGKKHVIDQYQRTVRPRHLKFFEPRKRYADIIIPEGGSNDVAVDMLLTKVRSITSANESV